MKDYKGKVVAITGAAHGIGKGLADWFAQRGAKLALGDIDAKTLAQVEAKFKAKGTEIATYSFDVAREDEMIKFGNMTYDTYGTVDYFFGNAGIMCGGDVAYRVPMTEWRRAYDINVLGIVNGIRTFVPRMIEQNKECWVVTTASNAGLQIPASAVYSSTKAAAISISENLHLELALEKRKIKVAVFCPGWIQTDLVDTSLQVKDLTNDFYHSEDYKARTNRLKEFVKGGLPLAKAIEAMMSQLEEDKFYIYTHPEQHFLLERRAQRVLESSRPTVDDLLNFAGVGERK